jgi:CheY-like chemotaxis protein
MPGMDGLQLQSHLLARNQRIPIIFISAHREIVYGLQGIRRKPDMRRLIPIGQWTNAAFILSDELRQFSKFSFVK